MYFWYDYALHHFLVTKYLLMVLSKNSKFRFNNSIEYTVFLNKMNGK